MRQRMMKNELHPHAKDCYDEQKTQSDINESICIAEYLIAENFTDGMKELNPDSKDCYDKQNILLKNDEL